MTRCQGITNRSRAKSQNARKPGPTPSFPAKSNTLSRQILSIFQADLHSSRRTKQKRFRQVDNLNIAENNAFILSDAETRKLYAAAYERSSSLYYAKKPTFEEILAEIKQWADKL